MALVNLHCLSIMVFISLIITLLLDLSDATQYTVGGSSGWNVGVDYSTWASQQQFKIGDTLEFKYDNGVHSVAQVSEVDFKACSSTNAITTSSTGNTVVKLEKAQTYYFICGVQSHCQTGMQLSVHVGQKNNTSPITTSSTSTASSPTTPTSSSLSPESDIDATPNSSMNHLPCAIFHVLIISVLSFVSTIF